MSTETEMDPLEAAWKQWESKEPVFDFQEIERLSDMIALPPEARIVALDGPRGPMVFFSKEQEEKIGAMRERAEDEQANEWGKLASTEAGRALFCEPSAMADAETVRETASDVIDLLVADPAALELSPAARAKRLKTFAAERRNERDCAKVMHL